jgi:hypothetical protein
VNKQKLMKLSRLGRRCKLWRDTVKQYITVVSWLKKSCKTLKNMDGAVAQETWRGMQDEHWSDKHLLWLTVEIASEFKKGNITGIILKFYLFIGSHNRRRPNGYYQAAYIGWIAFRIVGMSLGRNCYLHVSITCFNLCVIMLTANVFLFL